MKKAWIVLLAVVCLAGGLPSSVWADPFIQVVQITGHRLRFDNPSQAAFVRYLLIDPSNADPEVDGFAPFEPAAILMLFTGGDGRLFLTPTQRQLASTNFLMRTRYHFAAQGFAVAAIDAASDFLDHNHSPTTDSNGFLHGSGLMGHRPPNRLHGDKYAQDLAAVITDLRLRYLGLPLWAVGTSRGTISAALAALASVPNPPDGIVLTSSLTGPNAFSDLSPANVNLQAINVPTLIVTNQDDECPNTKPEDSKRLRKRFTASPRVQVRIFNGGSILSLSGPCDPLSGHGFFGIEQKVIEAIGKWIKHEEN